MKNYSNLPSFAEIANFLEAEKEPLKFTGNEKRKFLREARHYVWDEPYLYRQCKNRIFRRCVSEADILGILHHCHGSSYAGHFATFKTVSKILHAGFWWPTMFRDAHAFILDAMHAKMFSSIIFPRFVVPRVVISDGGGHPLYQLSVPRTFEEKRCKAQSGHRISSSDEWPR